MHYIVAQPSKAILPIHNYRPNNTQIPDKYHPNTQKMYKNAQNNQKMAKNGPKMLKNGMKCSGKLSK